MKTGEVAARLNVTAQTVRNWKDKYADFVSPHLGQTGKGGTLFFNDKDVRVLATIAECKQQRFTHEEILKVLERGQNLVEIPPLPSDEEIKARAQVQLVPVSEYLRVMDRVLGLEQERDRLITERDEAEARARERQEAIERLQKELGLLQGQLKERNREEGREDNQLTEAQAEIIRLNREIARMELQLEMAEEKLGRRKVE
jgi:DNA-binding transcriptional MerR regulator